MGKASRWLINFLLGKKDDKVRKKNISISIEDHRGGLMTIPSATPLRRKWSFGKLLANKERAHKSSRSLESMAATPVVNQAVPDMENQNDGTRVLAMAEASATKKRAKVTYAASLISKSMEDEAATRIQAAFRSYLARKALHALRGLVKLQALVRGHLVRKQTTAALRSMHALIAIQVRARFQRILTAEEPQLAVKGQSSRYRRFPAEMGFKRSQTEAVGTNLYDKHGIVKNQNGFTNHSKIERIEQGITSYYHSGEHSISKKEQKYKAFSFTTHNSPRHSPPLMFNLTPGRSSFSSHEYPFMPNYMANTRSSRAKVRSQSEPKQRPKDNKRTASAEEMNDNNNNNNNNLQLKQHSSSSQSKGVADENQEPWFVRLHQSTK